MTAGLRHRPRQHAVGERFRRPRVARVRAPRVRAVPAVVARPGRAPTQAVPLPRPRTAPGARAVAVGPAHRRGHRAAPAASATCSRWGRSSGSSSSAASPTGSRNGSGWARSRSPAALGCALALRRCSARAGSARSPARSCTCSRRTSSRSPPGSRCSCSPWAALPWLVGLTIARRHERGGWRDPALVRARRS